MEPDIEPPFVITEPTRQTAPFVFNAPHAGSHYTEPFLRQSRLDAMSLRRSEDAHVDALFAGVVALGAPLMSARFPRAYVDVNREAYELDPRMFEGRLPPHANTRSMRVAGGLGTIPKIVADGQEIYRTRLSVQEALRRIEDLYKPYHRALRHLMKRTLRSFGHVILIDCHSMPSTSLAREEAIKADIVLGDRYGTSCAGRLTDVIDTTLRAQGFSVLRNKPYAGGFITEHYGEPGYGQHALQVEINRALYMNERTLDRRAEFGSLAATLQEVFRIAIAELGDDLGAQRMAAE